MTSTPKLLLLTGIPGTGKTDAGEYLAREHGFVHMDAEVFITGRTIRNHAELDAAWTEFRRQADGHRSAGRDVVITWGFIPGQDDPVVRALQVTGFKMVWFDGDRGAARRAFLRRGTVPGALFDLQMSRIAGLNLESFAPVRLNPFTAEGRFRTRQDIANELLAPL